MTDITLPVITCPHDIQLITAETQPEEWRVCRLYVLIEPTPRGWIVRYIGKTVQPLASRCAQHRRRARTDHLCAPLYRYAAALEHGDCLDNWEIRELYSFQYDPVRCPDAPVQLENYVFGLRAATKAARAQSTRSGSVPPARVDAQLQPAFGDRDVRLRSVAPNVREKEAQRRLRDEEEPAGRAGRNNCRLTGPATDAYNKGKRPWAFSKRKVGPAANLLCEPVVRDAWTDPEHIAEERRLCGDRNYVYPYTRKGKRVKGHCRKLSGPQAVSMEVALE
eukprot:COSAG03_NODE_3872_length_1784_cov_4.191691_1_plen_277_part_10